VSYKFYIIIVYNTITEPKQLFHIIHSFIYDFSFSNPFIFSFINLRIILLLFFTCLSNTELIVTNTELIVTYTELIVTYRQDKARSWTVPWVYLPSLIVFCWCETMVCERKDQKDFWFRWAYYILRKRKTFQLLGTYSLDVRIGLRHILFLSIFERLYTFYIYTTNNITLGLVWIFFILGQKQEF
jgi:hypothetical protein